MVTLSFTYNNNYFLERIHRMSTDENTNDKDISGQHTESNAAETARLAAENAKNAAGNILANAMALKDSNPKVFFGGIAAVVALLLIVLMGGGGPDGKVTAHQSKAVVIGQSYVLKGANAYDPQATIRLVSVPGSMAAYDDTEEADREGCKHVKEGTPVKVVQSQDAYGKKDVFVEVEITSGECTGKKGWALAINLQ
jgi:type IV secretory pathway VirB2 component (pilin)